MSCWDVFHVSCPEFPVVRGLIKRVEKSCPARYCPYLFLPLGLVLQFLHRTLVVLFLLQHHHIQDHPESNINITTQICPPSCVSSQASCASRTETWMVQDGVTVGYGFSRKNNATNPNCQTHSGAGGSLLSWWTRSTHGYVPIERTDCSTRPLHRVSEAGELLPENLLADLDHVLSGKAGALPDIGVFYLSTFTDEAV